MLDNCRGAVEDAERALDLGGVPVAEMEEILRKARKRLESGSEF
jgi:DNA-binding ferritin-like protein